MELSVCWHRVNTKGWHEQPSKPWSCKACCCAQCHPHPTPHTLSLPILAVPTVFYTLERDQHPKKRMSYLTTGRRSLDLTFHYYMAPAAPT